MTIAPLRRVEFRLFAALAMLAIPFAGLWSSDAPVPVSAGSLHASWAFDVADDRYIVGASDFVFFGEILAATPGPPLTPDLADDTDAPWFPQTAYVVRALSDIKGDLSTRTGTEGEYTMLQAGGIGPAGSEEYFDEDGALQVGATYLLITELGIKTLDPKTPCGLGPCFAAPAEYCREPVDPFCSFLLGHPLTLYLIAPGYDHNLVDDATEQAALVVRYTSAYQNEIVPTP